MKTKLMKTKLIATGLVALGLGQITAQKPTPAPTPPVFVADRSKPQTNANAAAPVSVTKDFRVSGAAAANTATLTTVTLAQVTGNVPVYACVGSSTPASGNCATVSPPPDVDSCGTWPQGALITGLVTVQCPLNFTQTPIKYTYWMPTCSGNPPYQQVGEWNLSRDAANVTGTCKTGYQAATTRTFISPDCQIGQGCNTTFIDQDLSYSATTSFDDCGAIYYGWTFGPFPRQTTVHVNGYVDDDVRISPPGEILDPFCCLFNSGRNVQCDGLVNGAHNFDTSFALPVGIPVVVEVINNFASGVSLQGHITIK